MKNYEEVLDWLFVQIPNYQRQGGPAYKPGLDNIKKLLQELKNPQELFPSVHLAGTNGKGSTAHILSAIYQANGYKVGLFTSPHLVDFRERIKINGEMISQDFVIDFVVDHQKLYEDLSATFFEICTAMAFQAFKEAEVDIAIIETGMGGRLDSTNVLNPALTIITSIGLDHSKYLGDTLEQVAMEKAGIIKEGVPVVIGTKQAAVCSIIEKFAKEKNAEFHYFDPIDSETDLLGAFQQLNIATALKAVDLLKDQFVIDSLQTASALTRVAELSNFKGRFQRLSSNPDVIFDVAHNPAAIRVLMMEVNLRKYTDRHFIFGASNDKDLKGIFELLPKNAYYYFTQFEGERAVDLETLRMYAIGHDLEFTECESPSDAMKSAKTLAKENDLILVFGSFFLLGELY